ncbi:MAG TPA: ABC transporter substrate-binding protein, partial [Jiangellaceae bacterium]|nr:ABC transporter substrate-binding protein [Jiangellaceae bacterium]
MSRPQSESEYLARLIPPSVAAAGLSRRGFLKGTLGAGAAVSLSSLLAACGGGDDGGGDSGSASQEVTFGSNQSDAVPKKAYADMLAASGMTVKVNTIDHNTFQENINNYLQGNPDDVFTWFAGYRMRFFAAQGLVGDLSDVYGGLTGFSEAFKQASTGDDGKQYFVPLTTYPWAIFYRKSVFEEKGYQAPKTLDELTALGDQMKKDGLIPIAFADKDGWPAMGTFDYLTMRINGYDFHVNLMAGKESWTDAKL